MFKKTFKMLLCLSLTLGLVACEKTEVPTQSFAKFTEEVETFMIDGTTSFNMNFFINDPVALGFEEPTTYGLGFVDKIDSDKAYEQYAVYQKQLHAYDYEDLSAVEKRTYDALDDYLSRELALKDFYYYDNPVIGSYSATIHELPLLLEMYAFNDERDLVNFFKNIAQFKDDFLRYAGFEATRIEKGLGYSQEILDDIIEQLEKIVDEGGEALILKINQTISELDFLTESQKVDFQTKNTEVIKDDFIGAYKALLDVLKMQKGLEKTEGLYHKKNGKAYYEAMVYNQLGIKDDIEDIEKRLEEVFKEQLAAFQAFAFTHSNLLEIEDLYNIQYSEFSSPEEGLYYLKDKIFNIVPEISDLNFQIYTVPENLQEGFAPAAYLQGRIDMKSDQEECVMINPTSTANIFPTLVHEGYPGHMYQHTYFNTLSYPTLNKMIDCIGYTEGWAIYVQNKAADFIENKEEADWQTLLIYDEAISSPLLALMDIGIHYHGWDYDDCRNLFKSKLGYDPEDSLKELYDIIIQTPAYYLYYIYSGQILMDLHDKAKDELGSTFNEIEFNKAILDSGPVGLDVVRKNVQKYIDGNKK